MLTPELRKILDRIERALVDASIRLRVLAVTSREVAANLEMADTCEKMVSEIGAILDAKEMTK